MTSVASSTAGRPSFGAVATLLKPITWFAAMWAFLCGVISSGVPAHGHWLLIFAGVLLAGPMVCGTSQAVNDWFDRHVDAINEPDRPIPSGRIPGKWGLIIALIWTALSVTLAACLGKVCLVAAALGLILAWMYSAPPFRLKLNGWWGNAAVAASYEGLAWVTGAGIMAQRIPDWHILLVAGLYSVGAHGIMTLNDFKSIEGDLHVGIKSLPAQLGVKRAVVVACAVMGFPQGVVLVLLSAWHLNVAAATVAVLLMLQLRLMTYLIEKPRDLAPWYNGTGTTLYVLGMMVTAFALRTGGLHG
jgi:chlorophyll synthase